MNKVACVGGGQLAQMLAEAAEPLDVSVRSASALGSCAFSSCEPFTQSLDNPASVDAFFNEVDVFTFESEHEGLDIASEATKRSIPIYPPAEFVEIAGDRLLEKTFLSQLRIPIAPFVEIPPGDSTERIADLLGELLQSRHLSPHGIVVKTRRGGYDGKGQWVITDRTQITEAAPAVAPLSDKPGCIVEGLVDFSMEVSVLATRSISGNMTTWPITHNIHRDSILRFSYAPVTDISDIEMLQQQAEDIVHNLCEQSDYVGTIAVECFVTDNGLVVNEIAPRVHNSGHWTIEGSETSQFEQHIRAITGRDLGSTQTRGFVAMINLVGIAVREDLFNDVENTYLHWYGKDVRDKRKVGHVTVVGSTVEERDQLVDHALGLLDVTRDEI